MLEIRVKHHYKKQNKKPYFKLKGSDREIHIQIKTRTEAHKTNSSRIANAQTQS